MLTKEQIEYLFQFCQEQGVKHYDVQVELVDHLANAIEKDLQENPGRDFFKALGIVFDSFGDSHFATLLMEKQQAAKHYSQRLFWSIFREQLRWPWILMAIGLFGLVYRLLVMPDNRFLFYPFSWLIFIANVIGFIGSMRLRKLQEKVGKRFMMVNMNGLIYAVVGFSVLLISFNRTVAHFSFLRACIHSGYILFMIAYYRTLMRLKDRLLKDYPEIFHPA